MFWKKIGTVYNIFFFLNHSTCWLSQGFGLCNNFVLRAKNSSVGICLLLLVPLENMPFHFLVVQRNMVISFPSQKLCIDSYLMQTISYLFNVSIFYSSILLVCIINLIFACSVWIDDLQYFLIIILIGIHLLWCLCTLLSFLRHPNFWEPRLVLLEEPFVHRQLFIGFQALEFGYVDYKFGSNRNPVLEWPSNCLETDLLFVTWEIL